MLERDFKKPEKKTTFSTNSVPSIKELEKKISQEKLENPQEEIDRKELKKQDFSYDDLKMAWNDFSENIRDEKPRDYNTLISQKIELTANYCIKVFVGNELLKQIVLENHNELLHFLRRKLSNDFIKIDIELVEKQENDKIIYLSEDKFKVLCTLNPHVIKLKQAFNLDFS